MGEVTRDEFDQLKREISEIRVLAETILLSKMSKDDREEWPPDKVQAWLGSELERREDARAFGEDGVYRLGLRGSWASYELGKAGLRTAADVAAMGRREVATLPRVGRATLRRLDEALAERGLSWANDRAEVAA